MTARNHSVPLYLISGIPPNETGTGRLISFLNSSTRLQNSRPIQLVCDLPDVVALRDEYRSSPGLPNFLRLTLRFAKRFIATAPAVGRAVFGAGDLVVFHPQFLGFRLTLLMFRLKRRGKRSLFLLDNSFFCIKSYNYISGESGPCLRCLGGAFENQAKMNCKPAPRASDWANRFVVGLMPLVNRGQVTLIAQCESQAKLAKKHFSIDDIPVSGIWTNDFEESFTFVKSESSRGVKNDLGTEAQLPASSAGRRKVVFHGHDVEAKGFRWVLSLAAVTPEVDFLFPFSGTSTHPNIRYAPMSWETGLKSEVAAADAVLVPSIWSAPIEGALLKSIQLGKRVLVIENPTTYASELPSSLVVTLPTDIQQASLVLQTTLELPPVPREQLDRELDTVVANMREQFLQTVGF